MGDNSEEIAEKITLECMDYAEKAVGKLYGSFTAPSKTASSNGTIIDVCVKNGGVNRYKSVITPEIEESCNTYADKITEKKYNPSFNQINFGSSKGAVLSLCLEKRGVDGYQEFVAGKATHGLPEKAKTCPEGNMAKK